MMRTFTRYVTIDSVDNLITENVSGKSKLATMTEFDAFGFLFDVMEMLLKSLSHI